MSFMKKIERAHSNIDSLINMDSFKNKLSELTKLKSDYKFGKNDKFSFQNNIINSFVDSHLKKKKMEDLIKLSLRTSLGSENKWDTMLQGGKDWGKFSIGRKF